MHARTSPTQVLTERIAYVGSTVRVRFWRALRLRTGSTLDFMVSDQGDLSGRWRAQTKSRVGKTHPAILRLGTFLGGAICPRTAPQTTCLSLIRSLRPLVVHAGIRSILPPSGTGTIFRCPLLQCGLRALPGSVPGAFRYALQMLPA